MKKNTVVTMMIVMLLSVFLLGMNPFVQSAGNQQVDEGIWVADTIEGFNNAYLIVFHSDAGTHSYVVQDGVSFGELLPEVPPRESCLGYWLIDGTTDSFLTSGTPLTRDLSVSAYYEYVDGAGDYMAGRSGILMRYSDKDKPADDHTGNNDKQLVSSEMDSNGNLKRVMASKVTADNEPPVWFFDYAGLYGSNENVSLYYVRSSLGYLKVEGNSLKISSDPVRLLVLLLDDDGVCISSENNAYSQDWANGKIKDFKNYFSDSQKFYLYNGTFGNELVTLSFDPDGGNIIPVFLTDYKGKTVRIPGYQGNRYGYEFQGWARERRASEPEFMPNDVYTFEKDETLFAVWKRIAPVRVFIDPKGGTPAEGYAFNQYPGVEIDWSKYPVENGQHELLGWTFEGDASVPEFGPGETYTVGDEDKTLYAVWDVLVDVKANGGNGDVLLRYAPDTEIDLSAINVSKGEHQLLGWAESAGGEIKYQPDAKLTAKADLTLYAVWDNEKIYVAFYNFDGSVLSRHSYAPDENPGTLPVPAVSSRGEDYEFLGWTTIEGDSEPQLTPEQTAIQAPDADTYYYQVWIHWVTVTFEAENAQTNPDKMRLAAGAGFLLSEIEIIQSAEDGRLFSYWTDGLNFYLQTGTLLVPDHDVTLKAVWKSPLYTIKFDKNGGNAAAPASEKLRYGEILEHLPEYSGTKTGYDFLGWAEGKDRNVDKDPNGTDTKHYLKIYRPGESYQMNYEKDIVLYAYWNPKTVNQKEGVKFGLRLDGVIPNEPSGFSIGEYSTQYYAGHVSDEIHNPGNVFKWGIQPTQEWVYDLDTDEGDLIDYYKDNAVVRALGYNVPSLDEVKRMSDNSFDPEKQFVIWYVLKYHGRTAKDYVVEGSPSCPEGSKIDAQGFCLNADGKRFNETGGDNRNGQKLWNVDGVIVNKKNIWVNYEPGLSGITVLNMPARYSMYIQKNRQGEPIAKNIKVGATFMKNEFKPYKPEAKDYIFLGWKVKGGDDTLYMQMADYSLTDNVTFVAQWRRPSTVNSSVSKIWSGDDGYGVRPDSITVSLWQQIGSASPSRTSVSVTLPTEDGKWSYMVSGLPQFSSETATTTGTPITYFWRENTVPDLYVETHNDTNNSTYITNTFTPNPSLNVVKTADPESGVEAGDTVTYTVVVTNNGNVTVSDISMKDTLYEALSNKEAFTLQPAGSKEFTYTYTATQADVDAGKIDNTVTAAGKDPRNDDVTASDDAEVTTVAAAPAITVVKTSDPTSGVEAGDTVTYTVVVTNTGNVTVSSIEMEDTLVKLNAAPFDLAPGESKNDITYTYTVTQADVDAGKIDNTATATGKDPKNDDVTASDDAEVTAVAAAPAITVEKTANPTSGVIVGDTVTYTVVVTNSGNVTLHSVTLDDSMVELDEASYTLTPGGSETVTYTYTVTQADVDAQLIRNIVKAEGFAPDERKLTAQATADVTPVVSAPNLKVEKTANPKEGVKSGNTVHYTVVVTNTGNVTIHDIQLTDTLVEQNEAAFSLTPGGTKTFTYTYTATQADVDAGRIDNTAAAAGLDPQDQEVSASDDETVTTLRQPGISVTKTASPKTGYKLGDTVTYTIVVTNTGNLTLHDIVVADDLTGTKWTEITLAPGASTSLTDTYVIKASDVADAGSANTPEDLTGKDVINTVTVTGKDPSDESVNATDSETISTVKIPLTIKAASDEKTYNGTPLINSGWEHIAGVLVEGNKIQSVTVTGSQTNYGSSPNEASAAVIMDEKDENVSSAYAITYVDGTLNVLRRPVIVEAENKNKVYGEADPQLTAKVSGLIGGDTINYELSREPGEDVGMYTITPSGDEIQGNYVVTYRTGILEITQRPLSIIAGSGSKTYDGRELTVQTFTTGEGRDSEGNPIGGGLIPGDNVVPESLTITGSIINVGTETNRLASSAQITNKAGKDVTGNYSINYVNGLLTITPAKVVVKADDKTKVYGNADPELTAHVYGLINESDVIEYSLSRAEGENVGNYTITPTGEAQQGNYIVTYETGTLTITPKPLTITALSDTKPYDGTALTKNSYIKTDLAAGDVISSVTVTGSQTYVGKSDNVPSAAEIKNAAGEVVTDNYTITYKNGELEVTKRDITITADSATKVYDGSPLTKDSYTNTDPAAGDTIESVVVTGSQTVVGSSPNTASNAKIVRGDVDVTENYNITYLPGELTVTQNLSLVITADSDTKVYDGSPLTKNSYTYDGLAAGDRIESVTVTGTQTKVGKSDNVPSAAKVVNAAGEDVTASYAIVYKNGTLEVTPKPLTITAADATKTYDSTPLTKNAYAKTALAEGDEIVAVTISGSQTNVGESANKAESASIRNSAGEDVTNCYAITYVDGTLKVTPKTLTITAGTNHKEYDGTALTENSYKDEGLVGNDTIESVTVTGSQTLVGKSNNVPSAAKIVNNGEDVTGNYEIIYANGTLEVTKKPVTVTANSDAKVYDGKALTKDGATTTDLAAGDKLGAVTVTGSQTNVGYSNNVPSEAKFVNADGIDVTGCYEITYENGILRVTPMSVTITADSDSKVYDGTALTKDSYSNTALAEGDHVRSVTITGSQTVVGDSENVPTNARIINASGQDVTGNYAIGYGKGTLTVTPMELKITADSAKKIYDGTPLTKDSFTNTELAEGDSVESVVITGSQTVVGSSFNTASGAKIVNAAGEDVTGSYVITYATGNLVVTPLELKITAASDNKVYDGTALTNSGYTGEGLAAGDRIESAVVTGSRTTVGTADNVASSAKVVNANGDDVTASYTVSYEKGILKVTPKKLVITADSDEKVYDGRTLRKDSYTSTGLASGDSFSTVTVTGMQTLVGKSDNVPDKAGIINAEREDVTSSYEIEYVNGTLEVTPKPITVTADNAAKVYDGTPLTKDSFTSTDPASGDRVVSAVVTGSQTEVGTSDNVPSEAKILSRGGNDVTFCYDIKYASGTLEVTPKALTITADSDYKVYDGTALTRNSYTNSALGAGDTITSVTVSGTQINVGTAENVPDKAKIVNADGEDVTSSYAITYVNGELEVTPKPVTITAGSDTKVYDGTALTKDSYTNTGLAAGDSIDEVKVTGSQTAAGTSDNKPSDAVILNGAGENVTANYAVTYTNGTLEVTKKPLTIIADSDTRVYDGTALTKDSYENTALAAGDSISSVTVTGSQTVKGTSDNVPRNAVINNSDGENVTECYEVNYVNGMLEVTPKPVTVTADSASKIYDGTPLTKNSYTNSELAAGDSFSVVVVRGSQTNAGSSYNVASGARIVNAKGTDVTDSYDITYVKGLLEVTIYPSLVITAASESKTYDGKPLTKDGYTSSALMPGDTLVSVVVRGTITNVGNVPNVPSAAEILNANGEDVTGNYHISYIPGTLVVMPKTVRITAASDTKVYDGTELTNDNYSIAGLVDGEDISSITVEGSQTDAGRHANEVSNAVIVDANGQDVTANYAIEYVAGELEVTQRPITITAKNGKKVYDGSDLVVNEYTASNVASSDKVDSVTVTGSQLNVGTSGNVPSNALIVNGNGTDVTRNYAITYKEGTLEVTPKPITITAEGAEKVYDGKPLTKDAYTNTDPAEGDFISSVKLTGSQTNVGSSDNVPSDALIRNKAGDDVTANYAITYKNNTLTVTPKRIVITGGDAEKVYDGTELTNDDFSTDDLADGDTVTSITVTGGQTNAGSSANTPSDAVITNENGEDVTSNYEIVYDDGTLTVTKKPIIITAGSAEKVYDSKPLTNDEYETSAEGEDGNGLAGGDSVSSVKVEGSRTNVGTSPNVASDAVLVNKDGKDVTANYDITYVDGSLTVTPKTVIVKADDQEKEFGQDDKPLTVTIEGNLNNDPIKYEVTREDGEEPGTYPITPSGEEEQGNYIVVYVPGTMTITYNPTAATISKIWVDDSNRDGIRPVSLAVTLTGSDGSVRTRRLNDANSWKVTIDDLPLYYNNEPIVYTWSEEAVEGYTLSESVEGNNAVFTNTHEIARTAVSVSKVWDDMNNAGGTRPGSLSVRLHSNGTAILAATLSEGNGWSATVNNLPLYENGSPVEYSWTEQSVSGYYPVSSVKSGAHTTFTNSNIYTLTIHYVYENGETAAGDYFVSQAAGVTFAVDSPEISGYLPNQDVVTGTQPAGNIEITVVYKAETPDVPVLIPTRTPTPTPEPTPVPTVIPHDEPEPQKDVPEPRVSEPDEEHPIVVAEPNILVDIDDLETALGLGEIFINNSGYALE